MPVMKQKLFAKALAVVLALTFTGCQLSPTQQNQDEVTRQVVRSQITADNGYLPEYPSIDAAITLPGDPGVQEVSVTSQKEIKAVWISYLEMATLLKNKSKKQFSTNIGTAFDNIQSLGLNTVIVQVRPFADALYDSDYYPWSQVITGTEGKDPGFDPLQIMVDQAKARGLRIEAWINPYRIRAADNKIALSKNNQAKKWMDEGSNNVISYKGVISYNPASKEARSLIVNGAVEIVKKYPVDGIHIDDYFYPSADAAFDKASYTAYQNGGGKQSLDNWRRSNVETLIKQMYKAIKAENKKVLFGISPQSSVQNNYTQQYLDVEKIAGTSGYCDYICPQIYFGYDNAVQPYAKTLDQWSDMVADSPVKLYVGLAVYKVGSVDSWAGSGKNEWTQNTDLLERMVSDARLCDSYGGFVLYRYDSIFKPVADMKSTVQKETRNLKSIL